MEMKQRLAWLLQKVVDAHGMTREDIAGRIGMHHAALYVALNPSKPKAMIGKAPLEALLTLADLEAEEEEAVRQEWMLYRIHRSRDSEALGLLVHELQSKLGVRRFRRLTAKAQKLIRER